MHKKQEGGSDLLKAFNGLCGICGYGEIRGKRDLDINRMAPYSYKEPNLDQDNRVLCCRIHALEQDFKFQVRFNSVVALHPMCCVYDNCLVMTLVVHVILFIAVMECAVDESKPQSPFLFKKKKISTMIYRISLCSQLCLRCHLFIFI